MGVMGTLGTRGLKAAFAAILVAVSCGFGAGGPPAAEGATIQFHSTTSGRDPGFIRYVGEAGERNQLNVDYLRVIDDPCPVLVLCGLTHRLILSDAGAPLIVPASEGRTETISNCLFLALAATCPVETGLLVEVGQGADTVTFRGRALTDPLGIFPEIYGGPGNDRLSGSAFVDFFVPGAGSDRVFGGPGRDGVDSRDGEADTVSCGGGADRVDADSLDQVAADCEDVDIF